MTNTKAFMIEKRTSIWSNKKLFLLCFLAANLFLASFYTDIWTTPSGVSRGLPVFTLLEEGTFKIDKYEARAGDKSKVGDHYYSDKAPFPTLVAVPFYWMMQKMGLTKTTENSGKKYPIYIWAPVTKEDARNFVFTDMIPLMFLGSFLLGSIPFAVIIFLSLKKILGSAGTISPVLLVMMSFYGSFIFVFAGTFFNHVISAMLLLLGYILIKDGKYFWSGLCVGFAFISEYTIGLAIPLWAIVIWLREKKIKNIIFYGLGTLPGILFIAWYNYHITGNPLQMLNAFHTQEVFRRDLSVNYGFRLPSLEGMWGLSFSFYMGLIPHVPVLLLCGYFLVKEMINKYPFKKLLTNYLAMFSIPFFLAIASFFTWWGGWSYGPRYCVCLAVILVYEGLIYLSGKKINNYVFIAITGFGLIATWLVKVTLMYMVPDNPNQYGPGPGGDSFKKYIFPEFSKGHFNANNLFTMGFDLSPETAAYVWICMFLGTMIALSLWYKKLYPTQSLKAQPVKMSKKK